MSLPSVEQVAEAVKRESILADNDGDQRGMSQALNEAYERQALAIARAVLALFEPETVTTAAELEALPVGSVVLDRSGVAWQKVDTEAGARWADATGEPGRISGSLLARIGGPATVLHRGGRP